MAEPAGASLLTEERARVLASGYKSRPFWGGITPRWVLRYLRAHDAFVSVDGGSYRVNRVTENYLDVQTSVAGDTSVLPQDNLHVAYGHGEGTDLGESFALYEPDPQQIWIRAIQTVLKVHTRVPTLYSAQHNQLEQQVRLAADHDAHEKRSAHAVIPTRCAMSPRRCMPTNVMRATFSYAAERASSSWGARATTQSTRPPDVRTVPSGARRVPA